MPPDVVPHSAAVLVVVVAVPTVGVVVGDTVVGPVVVVKLAVVYVIVVGVVVVASVDTDVVVFILCDLAKMVRGDVVVQSPASLLLLSLAAVVFIDATVFLR